VDPDSRRARVAVTDGHGRAVRDGGLARWLAAAAPAQARGEIAVALVSDRHIRTLNRTYRGKDTVTDVLSFPASQEYVASAFPPSPKATADPPKLQRRLGRRKDQPLGDIVIATAVARRQALEAGHSYATELRVLALHGLLHLLGYDHDDPHDRGRMARAEARLRRKGGLREGLIARARARRRPASPKK
jgi:probable rRNA maturation factor